MARASKGILMDSSNPESSKIVLRLDRLMVERQFSLNELAEKVGITNANLSKIKNNHITAMRFSTLAALCEILDCEVGDLKCHFLMMAHSLIYLNSFVIFILRVKI